MSPFALCTMYDESALCQICSERALLWSVIFLVYLWWARQASRGGLNAWLKIIIIPHFHSLVDFEFSTLRSLFPQNYCINGETAPSPQTAFGICINRNNCNSSRQANWLKSKLEMTNLCKFPGSCATSFCWLFFCCAMWWSVLLHILQSTGL